MNLENLPSFTRKQIDIEMHANNNEGNQEHDTFRNDIELEESE